MANHNDPTPANPTPGNRGHEVAPTSIEGVEASDLPDKGRGSVDQNIGKAMKRKTPETIGGSPQETGGDVGLRANPDVADAKDHGPRGKN